jgi:hypothetical protein
MLGRGGNGSLDFSRVNGKFPQSNFWLHGVLLVSG